MFSFYPMKPDLSNHYITKHHITLHYITCIYIYTYIVSDFWQDWDISSYALKMKSFQWTKCRKFFPEITFKDLSNQGICLFHQIINFYFLPSRIRFDFLSISIRSTFSSRQAVLNLVPLTLLTMCRRFLDILSICLIKSNLLLIP